jgi:hypothetical protein
MVETFVIMITTLRIILYSLTTHLSVIFKVIKANLLILTLSTSLHELSSH